MTDTAVDYAKLGWRTRERWRRYRARVEAMPRKLPCQECRGRGGWVEDIICEYGGPWVSCGYCCGTGLLTPWGRGEWLRLRREAQAREAGT